MNTEHRLIYRQLESADDDHLLVGLDAANNTIEDVPSIVQQQVGTTVSTFRSTMYNVMNQVEEVTEDIHVNETIEDITNHLSTLTLQEATVYIADRVAELPEEPRYDSLRYMLMQSLKLHTEQEKLESTVDNSEKSKILLGMLSRSLGSLRMNPQNMSKEITHNGVTMTIGNLVLKLEEARQMLQSGKSADSVEQFLNN